MFLQPETPDVVAEASAAADFFSWTNLKVYLDEYIIPFGINLAIALAIYIVGKMIARLISRGIERLLSKSKVDEQLTKFLVDLIYMFLYVIVIIAALERLGVKTTAAIAIIGAAGLAVGLALQGTLGNFAAGVIIILLKPYKLGELVQIGDHVGVVKEVKIFVTVLDSPDNKLIAIPNGQAISGSIVNFTANGKLRVDTTVGIGYGDDIKKAKEVIMAAVKSVPGVLNEPSPTVAVAELGDNSVNFVVRPWSTPEDYWDVRFGTIEAVKLALDGAGISIPYPQRDIHVIKEDAAKLGVA